MIVQETQDGASDNNDDITGDHEHRVPDRKFIRPLGDTQGDDCRQHQSLVSDGIKDGTQPGLQVIATGKPPVDPVTKGGNKKDRNRGESQILVGMTRGGGLSIIDRQHDKDRNQEDPGNGDLVRERHTYLTFRGGAKS